MGECLSNYTESPAFPLILCSISSVTSSSIGFPLGRKCSVIFIRVFPMTKYCFPSSPVTVCPSCLAACVFVWSIVISFCWRRLRRFGCLSMWFSLWRNASFFRVFIPFFQRFRPCGAVTIWGSLSPRLPLSFLLPRCLRPLSRVLPLAVCTSDS